MCHLICLQTKNGEKKEINKNNWYVVMFVVRQGRGEVWSSSSYSSCSCDSSNRYYTFYHIIIQAKKYNEKKNTTKNSLSILIIQRRFFKGGILREKKIDKNANFSIIWAADDALKFRCSLEVDKSWNCSLNVGGWNCNVAVESILEDLQTAAGQSD